MGGRKLQSDNGRPGIAGSVGRVKLTTTAVLLAGGGGALTETTRGREGRGGSCGHRQMRLANTVSRNARGQELGDQRDAVGVDLYGEEKPLEGTVVTWEGSCHLSS